MCTPAVALVAMAAATAVSAYSSIQQGKAANAQAEYQAQVSKNNQVMANYQAEDALRRGKLEERRQRLRTERLKGEQRAAFASNNVALDQGSPLDVLEQTAGEGELDALIIRHNAEREAIARRFQGQNYGAEAEMSLLQGKAAKKAGYIGAASSVLSGASTFAGGYANAKSNGWKGFGG